MVIYLEEKRGASAAALKRELTRLKNERLRMMERQQLHRAERVMKRIEKTRWRLGRSAERQAIIQSELTDIKYLRGNHTYKQYEWLRETMKHSEVAHRWGVDNSTLKLWAKQEAEKCQNKRKQQQ